MIDALVFDFDGVILETETPLYEAWRDEFRDRGADLPIETWIAVLGMPPHATDFYAMLESACGRSVDRSKLRARYEKQSRAVIAQQPVMSGVRRMIAQAKEARLNLGVASGSSRQWVTGHLERIGLLEYFDHITTAEDTERHKPDPEPYQAVVAALGSEPTRVIAFEDSPNGIKAAKAAGMCAVAVPTTMTASLAMAGADLRVDSLADLTLETLIERLNSCLGSGQGL